MDFFQATSWPFFFSPLVSCSLHFPWSHSVAKIHHKHLIPLTKFWNCNHEPLCLGLCIADIQIIGITCAGQTLNQLPMSIDFTLFFFFFFFLIRCFRPEPENCESLCPSNCKLNLSSSVYTLFLTLSLDLG